MQLNVNKLSILIWVSRGRLNVTLLAVCMGQVHSGCNDEMCLTIRCTYTPSRSWTMGFMERYKSFDHIQFNLVISFQKKKLSSLKTHQYGYYYV